nr:glycosyltransferase [Chloroflexota bacterium]
MKILHVYKDYYPVIGGIENHLRALAEGLARRGHEVTVLVCHPDARTE